MVTKRVKKYEKMMTHQIPSHLVFCTPGKNKKNKARDKFRDTKEKQTDTTTITYFMIPI